MCHIVEITPLVTQNNKNLIAKSQNNECKKAALARNSRSPVIMAHGLKSPIGMLVADFILKRMNRLHTDGSYIFKPQRRLSVVLTTKISEQDLLI